MATLELDRFFTFSMARHPVIWDLLHLGLAYLLALPIGWNREKEDRSAGIRTFPIVAVAACGFIMLGSEISGATADSNSRILQGLITGIGFIGGGAILKDKGAVTGTATAASIWNIGIVGAAVGLGVYHIALVLALINLISLKMLRPHRLPIPVRIPLSAIWYLTTCIRCLQTSGLYRSCLPSQEYCHPAATL